MLQGTSRRSHCRGGGGAGALCPEQQGIGGGRGRGSAAEACRRERGRALPAKVLLSSDW